MLDRVKNYVDESFANSSYGAGSSEHFVRTVHWLLQLKPDADEAMRIAAYAHDIERAFRSGDDAATFGGREFNDPEFLELHQRRGSELAAEFLKNEGYPARATERVADLIRRHEVGGDAESDLLKDADSISYLEVNAAKHIAKAGELGAGKVRRKVQWMYDRISSDEARELAKPFLERALAAMPQP